MQTEWTCIYCGGQGKVKYPRVSGDIEKPALIICTNCSKPSAYVWCDKCEMGGAIAETEFVEFPNCWICIQCGSKHQLPEHFYDTSFDFNPTKLNDPEWQKEKFITRTRRHISVRWIRNTILFFERNEKNLIGIPVVFAGISIVGILIMSQFLNDNSSFFSSLFIFLFFGSLSLLLLQVIIWLVLNLISGLFLTAYRISRLWK